MKYIGIVSRVEETKDDTWMIGTLENYRKALLNYEDITPILILPPKDIYYGNTSYTVEQDSDVNANKNLDELLNLCSGFIVPGGDHWYTYDEYIIKYALENNKPLLGICLGMQIMSVVDSQLNGDERILPKLIEGATIEHRQNGVEYVHEINIDENSKLFDILKVKNCKVNSRHRYTINYLNQFKVSAISEDGVIEAIEEPTKRFVVGVQWHPELMLNYDENMKKIFDKFVEESRK